MKEDFISKSNGLQNWKAQHLFLIVVIKVDELKS